MKILARITLQVIFCLSSAFCMIGAVDTLMDFRIVSGILLMWVSMGFLFMAKQIGDDYS